jgi:hypothetical protein
MRPDPARYWLQMLALRTHAPTLVVILGTLSLLQLQPATRPAVGIDGSPGARSPLQADADPWPHGMVMAPQIADSMAIVPDIGFPDSRDWPHGMVIGRSDTVLSALFAPLAATLTAPAPAAL